MSKSQTVLKLKKSRLFPTFIGTKVMPDFTV